MHYNASVSSCSSLLVFSVFAHLKMGKPESELVIDFGDEIYKIYNLTTII